jgi:SAM-dependent methyltransferase
MSASVAANINNTFFEGSYKEVWRGIIPPGLTEAEVDFILDAASLEPGNRVLDIMCGYGRHALELGRRGIQVTAADNLEAYISEVNEHAQEGSLPVEGVLADAVTIKLQGTYDAVVCMGNSFSFFNEEDALRLLQNLSVHLKKGGRLIINSWMIGEIAIRHFKEKDWYYVGNYRCVIESRYLFNPSRIEAEQLIIHPSGEIETTRGIDYILTLPELGALLNKAGFAMQQVFSTPRKKPFQLGDPRAYIVAEKL